MTDRERIRHCIELLAESLCARAKLTLDRYGPFASPHEAHSVIREELEELFDEVRKRRDQRSSLALRNEAIDIAVAALRFAAQVEVVGASGPARVPTEEEP